MEVLILQGVSVTYIYYMIMTINEKRIMSLRERKVYVGRLTGRKVNREMMYYNRSTFLRRGKSKTGTWWRHAAE